MATVRVTGRQGTAYEFVDQVIGQGGMKDVYFSPDKTYVVGFFRGKVDAVTKQRLEKIVERYRQSIFDGPGGDYWRSRFCWPMDVVTHDGRIGVVVPTYQSQFFFKFGSVNNDMLSIRGREKEGKWFASAKLRQHLDPQEKGTWKENLRQSLNLTRAVRRMHAAGLAHSDLSYKNVLVDPSSGDACIIDIDGLVVPGIFPPEVVGTPDFIAPEVIETAHLPLNDPGRSLPSQATDRHALAVLIYMYLFFRHPLRGSKVHDPDPNTDEELTMGARALFVEHPTDASNRVKPHELGKSEQVWGDPSVMPYTIAGPHLAPLFERAFVDGLHHPPARPIAAEWETALLRTMDMIQPCSNQQCEMKWFVFDNTTRPRCPLCKTPYQGKLPVLDLYIARHGQTFRPEGHRVMVWDGQSLFPYHVSYQVIANENLTQDQARRVGYFQLQHGEWFLVNERLDSLSNVTDTSKPIPIPVQGKVRLEEGLLLRLSSAPDGRLVRVSMAGG